MKKQCDKMLSGKIAYPIFGCLGFLFLFSMITGRELAVNGNLLWTAGVTARILGTSLAAGVVLGACVCRLFYLLAERRNACLAGEKSLSPGGRLDISREGRGGSGAAGGMFLVSFLLMIVVWLPVYLAYYPAICAYDAPIQTGQIVEGIWIDHHPIAHTLLIKGAMSLGRMIFGNVNSGIGIYGLVQMLFLAAVFAFGVFRLASHGMGRVWLCVVQLVCMFYPFHLYMSVTMTKDTVFTGFFLLQVLSLWEMAGRKETESGQGMRILFFLSTVGMILFRNNGKYAMMVLLVCLLPGVAWGKERRRFWINILAWAAGAFLAGCVLLVILFRAVGGLQGDKREMLSVPIQQLARTMVYHGGVGVLEEDDGTMGAEEKALVNDFILKEGYKGYRPEFADPVKSNTNTYVARYRTREFIATYLRLLCRYPGDFVNAFLALNAGYLYPGDVSHAWINVSKERPGGGYVQTRWDEGALNSLGIYKDSRWPWLFEAMERWADGNAYLKLPVVKYLFVPGVWLWLYLLLLGWHLIRREYGWCLPLLLVLGYFMTLLLGPAVQMRYIYPAMTAFPFLALSGCCGRPGHRKVKQQAVACDGKQAGKGEQIAGKQEAGE